MGPVRFPHSDDPAKPAAARSLADIDPDDDAAQDEWSQRQIAEGFERVKANTREMEAQGILDEHGDLVRKELPQEMLDGDKECDIV